MALLEAKNISKSFILDKQPLLVINDLSLSIDKGRITAITGASGAGKSTLLNILGGLDKPTSGEVIFNNVSLYSMKDKQLNEYRGKNMGFIFQFHYLLEDFTALENIMVPMLIHNDNKEDAEKRAYELIESVGLIDRKDHFPSQLSGGEQQRIAVARAMANKPEIILADEPTGNLDRDNSLAIFDVLKKQAESGVCVVIVTHDEFLASKCDNQIVIKKL